jgi:uncharacterized protein YutE (UPF0331/DUF86 family)
MYFIDRNKLESLLVFMTKQFELLDGQSSWTSTLEVRALERLLHLIIEAFLDVGNQLIDGFIMRDPGSYEDIVAILIDESVLPKSSEEASFALVNWRKALVQEYMDVEASELLLTLQKYLEDWRQFPDRVRTYLETELGPVSAFKPTNN